MQVNAGRAGANQNMRNIGSNVDPATVKFTGKTPKEMDGGRVSMMAASGEKGMLTRQPKVTRRRDWEGRAGAEKGWEARRVDISHVYSILSLHAN